ncbi:GntR family transcriptional regulator [Subtercola sp. Z020]|uniref:FadR/GntR family transcriptional regulator n=1 Tax=Subtercola sp. Z020 TaxID=2080582 RepID=UPI000CE770AF|nr:FCD domain-containing protein [Subtercola sp. Z020]PPF89518.1 GntR family transcriptional regulator [Subtercola sp. Z020]
MTDPITLDAGSAVTLVVAQLKAMIVERGLKSGDRLPPERQLASEMGVSRNTIREALGALAQSSVIEIKRGSGAFVRDLAPASLLDSMAFMIEISPIATLLDLLTLRRIVEAEAASLACVRITDEELAALEQCLDSMSGTPEAAGSQRTDEAAQLDLRFHQIINEAARNPALSALGSTLNSTTFRLRVSGGQYRSTAYPLDARSDHSSIYHAIRDRDPARASAAAAAHVGAVERSLRESNLEASG